MRQPFTNNQLAWTSCHTSHAPPTIDVKPSSIKALSYTIMIECIIHCENYLWMLLNVATKVSSLGHISAKIDKGTFRDPITSKPNYIYWYDPISDICYTDWQNRRQWLYYITGRHFYTALNRIVIMFLCII